VLIFDRLGLVHCSFAHSLYSQGPRILILFMLLLVRMATIESQRCERQLSARRPVQFAFKGRLPRLLGEQESCRQQPLPSRNLKRLMPELEQIRCQRAQVLMDSDSALDHVFFPDAGVVSCTQDRSRTAAIARTR